jgi:hypothetical protein
LTRLIAKLLVLAISIAGIAAVLPHNEKCQQVSNSLTLLGDVQSRDKIDLILIS